MYSEHGHMVLPFIELWYERLESPTGILVKTKEYAYDSLNE